MTEWQDLLTKIERQFYAVARLALEQEVEKLKRISRSLGEQTANTECDRDEDKRVPDGSRAE